MEQKNGTKSEEIKHKKKGLRYQRDKSREKVKGIFRFYEVPDGKMSFVYKEYKEDPVERYDLEDGKVYTLPLGVARHLNNNCWYPVHAYKLRDGDRPAMDIGKKVHRCGFQSLEFVDVEELNDRGEGGMIEEVIIKDPE